MKPDPTLEDLWMTKIEADFRDAEERLTDLGGTTPVYVEPSFGVDHPNRGRPNRFVVDDREADVWDADGNLLRPKKEFKLQQATTETEDKYGAPYDEPDSLPVLPNRKQFKLVVADPEDD